MAITSKFYTGAVNNIDWATGHRRLGYRYVVHGTEDMRPAISGAMVRGVSFEGGGASGGGIVDINDDVEVISLDAHASDRWHLVGIRRTWGTDVSEFDSIIGTAVRQLPSRPTTAGTEDFHPIGLAFVPGGGAAVTELIDLRLVSDNAGIMVAASEDGGDLIRGFMASAGTQLRIGSVDWTRIITGSGLAWSSFDHEPTRIAGVGAFSGGPGSGWARRAAGSLLVVDGDRRTLVGVSDKAGAQATTNSSGGLAADELIGKMAPEDRPPAGVTVPLTCRTTGDAGGVFGGNAFLYDSGNIFISSGAPNVNIRTVVVSGTWYVSAS